MNTTVTGKRCGRCKETKDINLFWSNRSMSDGLAHICISCSKGIQKALGHNYKDKKTWAIKNRKKTRVYYHVKMALKKGVLVAKDCEVCGSDNIHAHHDDYNKPLKVRWLCPQHHSAWHRNNQAIV